MGVAASYDNAERYGAGLRQLDAYAQQQIGLVPTARRRVLTSHDAFSYFGAAYGVTSLSPVDLSTEGEALARGVAAMVRQFKAGRVRTHYFQDNSTS